LLNKARFSGQPAFSGWCDVIVGVIGTQKVWQKVQK
jgi:hypothetical protein